MLQTGIRRRLLDCFYTLVPDMVMVICITKIPIAITIFYLVSPATFFLPFLSFFLASFVDSILIKIYTRKETQIEEERIEKFSKGSRRGNAAMLP